MVTVVLFIHDFYQNLKPQFLDIGAVESPVLFQNILNGDILDMFGPPKTYFNICIFL